MSMVVLPDQFVVMVELEGNHAPRPLPSESGFEPETAYRVLGMYTPGETAELYFLLSNDRGEPWMVSNRHTRWFEPETPEETHLLAQAIRVKANRFK